MRLVVGDGNYHLKALIFSMKKEVREDVLRLEKRNWEIVTRVGK